MSHRKRVIREEGLSQADRARISRGSLELDDELAERAVRLNAGDILVVVNHLDVWDPRSVRKKKLMPRDPNWEAIAKAKKAAAKAKKAKKAKKALLVRVVRTNGREDLVDQLGCIPDSQHFGQQ